MSEWFQLHWDDILAVLGAAYTLALLIVKLTPTPKDDRAVDKIGSIVLLICKVFGLTPFQGLRKTTAASPSAAEDTPPPSKRPTALSIIFLTCLLTLASCATFKTLHKDPRAEVVAAQRIFASTVNDLAILREQGIFTVEQADQITLTIANCREYLDKWQDDVEAGKPRPEAWDTIQGLLSDLAKLKGDVNGQR